MHKTNVRSSEPSRTSASKAPVDISKFKNWSGSAGLVHESPQDRQRTSRAEELKPSVREPSDVQSLSSPSNTDKPVETITIDDLPVGRAPWPLLQIVHNPATFAQTGKTCPQSRRVSSMGGLNSQAPNECRGLRAGSQHRCQTLSADRASSPPPCGKPHSPNPRDSPRGRPWPTLDFRGEVPHGPGPCVCCYIGCLMTMREFKTSATPIKSSVSTPNGRRAC